jgi:hypothetical protein
MKAFMCQDTDGGNHTFIIAETIRKAVDLFEDKYKYLPEIVKDITADGETIIIQGEVK